MTSPSARYLVTDFFSAAEIKKAFGIIHAHRLIQHCNDVLSSQGQASTPLRPLNDDLIEHVVDPAMDRLDKLTGHTNFPAYFAYVLQYAYQETAKKMGQIEKR